MVFSFSGNVWFWKGPAPHYFVSVPSEISREIKELEKLATYGWGMIPVTAKIGDTEWYTAMWPKDGAYILPLKVVIRKAENIEEGADVEVTLSVLTSR